MKASQRAWCSALLMMILAGSPTLVQGGQSAANSAPLTVEEVLKLSRAGLAEEVIVTKIRKNAKAFDLSTDELVELKRQGLTDNVIKYLLDPTQPYSAPAPPSAVVNSATPESLPPSQRPPTGHYPDDPLAAKLPLEPGLYRFSGDTPIRIETKMLLGQKEGAGLGKVLMKKGKTIAYLIGKASKTRIVAPQPVFYLRLQEGKAIEEFALVDLEQKADRRQLEIGSGPKPELKPESVKYFDPLEVGPHVFRVTTAALAPGEYLLFMVGSADLAKGNYGKGYDFGIQKR